jgi:hypothetical protein
MHGEAVRVVYRFQPYLVVPRADGALERAYGPFAPGTEPSLAECGPEIEVRTRGLLASLNNSSR